MLFYAAWSWQAHTTPEQVAERQRAHFAEHPEHFDQFRGYYSLAGGGAGFVLVEVAEAQELTEMTRPYMDLVDWDCRAVQEVPLAELKRRLGQG